MMPEPTAQRLVLHATNAVGGGSGLVIRRLIEGIARTAPAHIVVEAWVPDNDLYRAWSKTIPRVNMRMVRRRFPSACERFLETVICPPRFTASDTLIVLGDLPLRGVRQQTLFVHLAHLVRPEVDPYVSRSMSYRIQRGIFARQWRAADCIIVQTENMRRGLVDSYGIPAEQITIVPQPSPFTERLGGTRNGVQHGAGPLRFIYPAKALPHKNHILLAAVARACEAAGEQIEFQVTLSDDEYRAVFRGLPANVRNLGFLGSDDLVTAYSAADALFCPSVVESYGLTLIEAMSLGLLVIVADRPYARSLCGSQASYFPAHDVGAALDAIRAAQEQLRVGQRPDWGAQLAQLPADWTETAQRFLTASGVGRESI